MYAARSPPQTCWLKKVTRLQIADALVLAASACFAPPPLSRAATVYLDGVRRGAKEPAVAAQMLRSSPWWAVDTKAIMDTKRDDADGFTYVSDTPGGATTCVRIAHVDAPEVGQVAWEPRITAEFRAYVRQFPTLILWRCGESWGRDVVHLWGWDEEKYVYINIDMVRKGMYYSNATSQMCPY